MPKATVAILEGRRIDITKALELRDAKKAKLDFRCALCGEQVRPHREGTTGQAAHFEHRTRNPDCAFSRRISN